ncbi:MAG: hypothetical protein U1F40_06175 [Turneriella sp.]
MRILEKMIALQVIDQKWKDHLYLMDQLRDGIWTLGYAERTRWSNTVFGRLPCLKTWLPRSKTRSLSLFCVHRSKSSCMKKMLTKTSTKKLAARSTAQWQVLT